MQIKNTFTRSPGVKNPGGGKVLTETAGYISTKQRIENMMLAGQRLQSYREEKYDFPPGTEIDEDFIDPTRARNYDLSDFTQTALYIELKSKAAKRAQEEAAAAQKALEEAQEAPGGKIKEEVIQSDGKA